MLIPHTQSVTTLGAWPPGRRLNLEVDLLARYVVNYLRATHAPQSSSLEEALRRSGFIG
jgi:riboflavin synthase